MANPSNPRAARWSAKLDFDTVAGSESARQLVTLQGAAVSDVIPPAYVLNGFRCLRTGGTDGSLTVTVRYYATNAATQKVYEIALTIPANNDISLKTDLAIPLNLASYVALYATVEDNGADTTYDLDTLLTPIVVV